MTLVYHELRGPLGLMATAARSAAEDCTDDALRARCEVIVRAAERMLRTAGHLLELAHEAQSESEQLFDPAACVRATISHFRDLAVPVLIVDDRADSHCLTSGIPAQLEALIQSLINNALDHAEPGTPIRVGIEHPAGELRIEISNRRSIVRRHRGLGLGLYICENLSARLGASIDCVPAGHDFVTVVTLPLVAEPVAVAV